MQVSIAHNPDRFHPTKSYMQSITVYGSYACTYTPQSPLTRVLLCSHSQFHAQGASSFTFHKLPTIAPNPLRHTQVH